MKLNKKYLLAVLIILEIQLAFGVNFTYAICEKELSEECKYGSDPADCIANSQTNAKKAIKEMIETYSKEELTQQYNHYVSEIRNNKQYGGQPFTEYQLKVMALYVCQYKEALQLKDSPTQAGSSNQNNSSSNSAESKQSKSNQQNTNSQSNQSNNTNNSNTSSQNQSNSQSNSGQTGTDTYSDLNMSPEQALLVREAAQTYTAKNAAFEESHRGLKRTHNKEDEATRCLKMEGRKLKNICDIRVEYIFCAYKPSQKAFDSSFFEMAAAFDCERSKMGRGGIPPKGNAAGSFTAERVYVLACKDPSRPSGVTYERGRGLSGRCSE